jgi:hypothetical protein
MKTLLLLETCFFVHIKITKDIAPGGNVIEIPPAIFNHLVYHSNVFYTVWTGLGSASTETLSCGIRESGGRYYIVAGKDIKAESSNYLISNYWLKDI